MYAHCKQKSFSDIYQKGEFIGRGTFGQVYKIRNKTTNKIYAAKFISLFGLSQKQIIQADEQRLIHSQLSHQNIIKFYQSYIEDHTLIFIMQYCEYGDLNFYIKRRNSTQLLSQQIIMNIFIQILHGLNYLHNQKIIHRDLKPSNIFINSNGIIKIADFGIAQIINQSSTINLQMSQSSQGKVVLTGTPMYSSPQTCKNQQINYKSDVWSLGCILYQLCNLVPAFSAQNVLALATKIANQQINNINIKYSDDLNALIHWMLEKNYNQRPTIYQILQLTFIKKYIKIFKMEEIQYKTPQKIKTISSLGSQKTQEQYQISTASTQKKQKQNYKIIYHQQQLHTQNPNQQYYNKLKQSCLNLLGNINYNQMHNQVKQLLERVIIINEKDTKKIFYQLKQVYGEEYYDLSKAMLQIVEFQKQIQEKDRNQNIQEIQQILKV